MTGLLRSAAVLCALASSPAVASTAVPRIRSVNLSQSDLDVLSGFLISSYERASGAQASAGIEGATEVIETLAFALGPNGAPPILVRIQRRSDLGIVLAQAEIRIETLEQAPLIFDRLAEALVRRVPLEALEIRHGLKKVERSTAILGVKMWFGAALAPGYTFNALGSLVLDVRFERQTHFFEVGVGFVAPGPSGGPNSHSYGGFMAELGASRYLTGGDTAIYAGGGLLPRLIFSADGLDSPLNLAPYGQLGVTLDRSSSWRLYADVRVAQNVLPIRVAALTGAYPTELSGQIGIGW